VRDDRTGLTDWVSMGTDHRGGVHGGNDVYRLQQHLDRYPRYPATPSGVELRILERLFTPKTPVALELSAFPEPRPRFTSACAGVSRRRAHATLDGLAFASYSRIESKGVTKYLLAPFVVGFYERQLPWLTVIRARLLQYFEEASQALPTKKTTQMRTVPVSTSSR